MNMSTFHCREIKIILSKALNFILDLLFPKFCFGCKKEGLYVCQDCARQIQINHYSFCPTCKNKTSHLKKCSLHKTHAKFFLSPFSYDNAMVKNMIHSFKYEFIKSIGPELARFMIRSLEESHLLDCQSANRLPGHQSKELIIVPVPLHKKRLAWRGFNQSEILAKEISKNLNIKLFLDLKRNKYTKPQIEMADIKERAENIIGAFICENTKKVKGKTAILIDDMITTGATIEECARILKKSGAKEVWALTVAK